jgi:predicted component of type VI protein secretion system
MARMILSLDGQTLAEYNMTKERYTIGRLPDNDIRVDNAAVSGHHSLIINILNDSFLEDLNSTNGTYVNGKLIKKHALRHGDVITAGHHQLRYVDDQGDVAASEDEFERTMVIEPSKQMEEQIAKAAQAIEAIAEAAPAAPASAAPAAPASAAPAAPASAAPAPKTTPAAASAPQPAAAGFSPASTQSVDRQSVPVLPNAKLQVLSGTFAGRELELNKALTTLGSPSIQVAAITRRAEGFYIVHVDGGKENKHPLVNGQDIGAEARKLSDNDVIELAGVKMGFFLS